LRRGTANARRVEKKRNKLAVCNHRGWGGGGGKEWPVAGNRYGKTKRGAQKKRGKGVSPTRKEDGDACGRIRLNQRNSRRKGGNPALDGRKRTSCGRGGEKIPTNYIPDLKPTEQGKKQKKKVQNNYRVEKKKNGE